MSHPQNRSNHPNYNSQPVFRPIYSTLENNPTANNQQQYYFERQQNNSNSFNQGGFNLKGFSFESKEFYRPQQANTSAPLAFNVHAPLRVKGGKKTSRPFQKITKSIINHPFTKQLQQEFAKKQSNKEIGALQDFSKTTSTVNPSFFKQQSNYTQPEQHPFKKSHQVFFNKSSQSITTLQAFVKKGETQSKIFDNHPNHNSVSTVYYQSESARQKSLQKNRNNFFEEINKLNRDIKHLKEQNGLKDRKINETNSLLEFQFQKTNKLLKQIQKMQEQIRGLQKLNKYLEHQCNTYLQDHNKIKLQMQATKSDLQKEYSRYQSTMTHLRQRISLLQSQLNQFGSKQTALNEQIVSLKRIIKSQEQKLQERQTNSKIDFSQMNILKTKIENLQNKYEKLMLSHCENELKYHSYEQKFNEKEIEWKNQLNRLKSQINELQHRQKQINYLCNERELRIKQMQEQIARTNKHHQYQYNILKSDYKDINNQCIIIKKQLQKQQQQIGKLEASLQQSNRNLQETHKALQKLSKQLKLANEQKDILLIKNGEIISQGQKKNEIIKGLQYQIQTLKASHQTINKMYQQSSTELMEYRKQIQYIKASSIQIQSQFLQINSKYDSLLCNYNSQNKHYKEVQAQLIQNEFDYNILQKDFNQYTQQYRKLNDETSKLQSFNQKIQSQYSNLLLQLEEKSIMHKQLEEKNKQYLQQIQEANTKIIELQRKKKDIEEQIEINKKLHESQLNQLSAQKKSLQKQIIQTKQQYSNLQRQSNEYAQTWQNETNSHLQQLQQQLQAQYSALLIRHQDQSRIVKETQEKYRQSLSLIEEANLTMRKLQTQNKEIQKLIQINKRLHESQTNRLNADKKALQQELTKMREQHRIQVEGKEKELALFRQSSQLLSDEISSLMLIIQQNQQRYKQEKESLNSKMEKQIQQQNAKNQEWQHRFAIAKLQQQKYKAQLSDLREENESLRLQLQKKNSLIFDLEIAANQSDYIHVTEERECKSSTDLPSALGSPLKIRQYESQSSLPQPSEINYIEMDAQGILFLCDMLQIDSESGNILSQIVSRVQLILAETHESKKGTDSYKRLLQIFEIESNEICEELLIHEITTIKENLRMVIQQLKEEQSLHQALKKSFHRLNSIKESQDFQHQLNLEQLHNLSILNQELNENVMKLTATICNQKLKLVQAMKIMGQTSKLQKKVNEQEVEINGLSCAALDENQDQSGGIY